MELVERRRRLDDAGGASGFERTTFEGVKQIRTFTRQTTQEIGALVRRACDPELYTLWRKEVTAQHAREVNDADQANIGPEDINRKRPGGRSRETVDTKKDDVNSLGRPWGNSVKNAHPVAISVTTSGRSSALA